MAERPNENTDGSCEKCGARLICLKCRGLNEIVKSIEKQASIVSQKLANESCAHDSNIPDKMHAVAITQEKFC